MPAGGDYRDNLNPTLAGSAQRLPRRAIAGRARGRRALPVRAAGLLLCRHVDRRIGCVFNRTVSLKDTWAKIEKGQKKNARMPQPSGRFTITIIRAGGGVHQPLL